MSKWEISIPKFTVEADFEGWLHGDSPHERERAMKETLSIAIHASLCKYHNHRGVTFKDVTFKDHLDSGAITIREVPDGEHH
jgi:hypothetical protein